MPKSIFERQALGELHDRLSKLTPQSERRWGKMTAPRMICHLQDSLEVALAMKPAQPKRKGMDNAIVRWLVIYVLPWPKGKVQTAPEMLATQPSEWNTDMDRLRGLLDAASRQGVSGKWGRHPAFGELDGSLYGHLIYKHFNHHLTQFGV